MWNPPPTVTEHNGEPLAPDRDFFVAPPAEIGAVRTAHTSLKKGAKEWPLPGRVAFTLASGVVGFLLALGFDRLTAILFVLSDITRTPRLLWVGLFIPLGAYLGWRKSAFQHFCTFVGDRGCVHFKCLHERSNTTRFATLYFQDVSAVSSRLTRRVKNGVYQGTNFHFDWYSSDPETAIFSIFGTHHSDSKMPPASNFYNFARAAESAWYRYAAPRIDAEFAQKGSVKFYMGRNFWSVVGCGYLQIVDEHGKVSRCAAEDVGSVKLSDGYLTIRRKDAKSSLFHLFDHEGVFGFNYAAMHNARLFLQLFERSLGIRVQ